MITIKTIKKTCTACPAQWEGTTDDGREVYVRYRFGHLSVALSDEKNTAIENSRKANWYFRWDSDGMWSGGMDYDFLKKLSDDKFVWPETDEEPPKL